MTVSVHEALRPGRLSGVTNKLVAICGAYQASRTCSPMQKHDMCLHAALGLKRTDFYVAVWLVGAVLSQLEIGHISRDGPFAMRARYGLMK